MGNRDKIKEMNEYDNIFYLYSHLGMESLGKFSFIYLFMFLDKVLGFLFQIVSESLL